MRRWIVLATLSAIAPVTAQKAILDADAKPMGATSRTNIVRAGNTLYCLSIRTNGALRLLLSRNRGANWSDTGFTLNDNKSGIGSGVLTNSCCLAVDSRGWLHASWRRARYPSFYSQYYRNVNPASTSQSSDILDVQTNLAKVSATTRSVALGLCVDKAGNVWMLATHSSWRAQLFRSDQPFAIGKSPKFTSVGSLSPAGTASQNAALAVDASGVVHCMFHYANRTRSIAHNAYDPTAKKWSGVVRLATPANNNAMLATDRFGDVHTLYGVGGSSNRLEYRRWTKAAGWAKPIVVAQWTAAQRGTSNDKWIFTLAAQPVTGDAYAIYRDFASGGGLVVRRKGRTENAFSFVTQLEAPTTAQNAYFVPNVRGSLDPFPSNGMLCRLDVVYQDRSAAKTKLVYHGVDVCSTKVFSQGCRGSAGIPSLDFGELPRVGRRFSIDLSQARASSACVNFLGVSNRSWGAIRLPLDLVVARAPGCLLNVSPDIPFALPTTAQGRASLAFPMPQQASLVGTTLYTQFLVFDTGTNAAGLVTTRGGEFTIQR